MLHSGRILVGHFPRQRALFPWNVLKGGPGGGLSKAIQILNFLFQQCVIIFNAGDLFIILLSTSARESTNCMVLCILGRVLRDDYS